MFYLVDVHAAALVPIHFGPRRLELGLAEVHVRDIREFP